jgi:leucyl/phenylalanyl-tRNA---protein transferase
MPELTPQLLLDMYANGLFPMAEDRRDPTLFWVDPERRGVIPLDGFHVSRSLARTVRGDRFAVTVDTDFTAVIAACAAARPGRKTTWINDEIIRLYTALHAAGHGHSVECRRGGRLVGGLYGIALGGAFFGESMFSIERDASKVALVHLVARLKVGKFELLDTQFLTPHLATFGAREISRAEYRRRLRAALAVQGDFYCLDGLGTGSGTPGATVLQSITQTS